MAKGYVEKGHQPFYHQGAFERLKHITKCLRKCIFLYTCVVCTLHKYTYLIQHDAMDTAYRIRLCKNVHVQIMIKKILYIKKMYILKTEQKWCPK